LFILVILPYYSSVYSNCWWYSVWWLWYVSLFSLTWPILINYSEMAIYRGLSVRGKYIEACRLSVVSVFSCVAWQLLFLVYWPGLEEKSKHIKWPKWNSNRENIQVTLWPWNAFSNCSWYGCLINLCVYSDWLLCCLVEKYSLLVSQMIILTHSFSSDSTYWLFDK
jgi:hypothetical protein